MQSIATKTQSPATNETGFRAIALRTRGHRHGPIVRLVSPSDIGELIKPFVFLDHVNITSDNGLGFGFHPHSGIATLTLTLEGGFAYEDSTGASGVLHKGAVEWMQAGGGVWHRGNAVGNRIMGYQLWLALGPELESSAPVSQYLEADAFENHGPARVILGNHEGVTSPIHAPCSLNYLEVQLSAGEVWRYDPPEGHDVLWVSVHKGELLAPDPISKGELAVFEPSKSSVTFQAHEDSAFLLGSAKKHPYPLVLGSYSVHTTQEALDKGEEEIRLVAADLRSAGKV